MFDYNVENEKKDFEPIEVGDYAVVLSAEEKPTRDNTNTYLSLSYALDKKENAKYGGRLVFENVYKTKDNPNIYNVWRIKEILLTQGKDVQMKFEDNDELIQFLNGLKMKIHVDIEEPNQYHESRKNVVTKHIADSKWGANVATSIGGGVKEYNVSSIDVSDDDLPFK